MRPIVSYALVVSWPSKEQYRQGKRRWVVHCFQLFWRTVVGLAGRDGSIICTSKHRIMARKAGRPSTVAKTGPLGLWLASSKSRVRHGGGFFWPRVQRNARDTRSRNLYKKPVQLYCASGFVQVLWTCAKVISVKFSGEETTKSDWIPENKLYRPLNVCMDPKRVARHLLTQPQIIDPQSVFTSSDFNRDYWSKGHWFDSRPGSYQVN